MSHAEPDTRAGNLHNYYLLDTELKDKNLKYYKQQTMLRQQTWAIAQLEEAGR